MLKDEASALPYNEVDEDIEDPSDTTLGVIFISSLCVYIYIYDKLENNKTVNSMHIIKFHWPGLLGGGRRREGNFYVQTQKKVEAGSFEGVHVRVNK